MKKLIVILLAVLTVSLLVPNSANAEIEKKVKVSSNDSTSGYLNGKIVCGSNMTCVENSDGANESLQLSAVTSGSGMILDIDDDSSNESSALSEIAITNDTYSVFTEPSADKLLINLSNKWPASQTAVALAANGSNCSSGNAPLGVDASGTVESCFDVATQTEFDTHATRHNVGGADALTFYATVQEEGSSLTQRNTLNFAGAGITCADDTTKTTCTISSGGVTDHGALTGLTDDDHTQYALLNGRTGGQTLIGGTAASNNLVFQTTSNATKGTYRFSELVNCDTIDSDADGDLVCGTDASGSGGSPIILDLGDDSNNESTGITEIASSGDTNGIMSEPTADKLYFNFANDYPKADKADALNANGSNCSAGSWAAGVDDTGAAEGCTADDDQPDSDSEVPDSITVTMQAGSSIPTGTAPTVDADGEIAEDTTQKQLLFGSTPNVLSPTKQACFSVSDLTSSDDNLQVFVADRDITVKSVGCRYEGTGTTVATIALENSKAGTGMTHTAPTCVTGNNNASYQSVTANNAIVSGDGIRIDVTNTPAPTTDDYTICFTYTEDRK